MGKQTYYFFGYLPDIYRGNNVNFSGFLSHAFFPFSSQQKPLCPGLPVCWLTFKRLGPAQRRLLLWLVSKVNSRGGGENIKEKQYPSPGGSPGILYFYLLNTGPVDRNSVL